MEIKYEYDLLPVGDADAILIRHYINDKPYVILIDAGNEGDGKKIKFHLKKYYGTTDINLAICTHPDKDHKDGFFELLNDDEIKIEEFWLTDPLKFLSPSDFLSYKDWFEARKNAKKIWCKSNDEELNLIDLTKEKCKSTLSVIDGSNHPKLPITVVGPISIYYKEVLTKMVEDYGIKTYESSEKEKFDAAFKISEDDAKSSIDGEEDLSPYNASSLIILYEPGDGKKMLFAGDANTTSLSIMLDNYTKIRKVDLLKVPHHGSKHNLNTEIINQLAPKLSIISAAGTVKHPSRGIVYWLSKYGSVFSTHQCSGYLHYSYGNIPNRNNSHKIEPLRKKQ